MEKIFNDVKTEIEYATAKFGDEFGKKNTLNDWATYTTVYLGKATAMNTPELTPASSAETVFTRSPIALMRLRRTVTLVKRHYE